jgi:hypothetical protein
MGSVAGAGQFAKLIKPMTSIEISMLSRERETSQNLDSSHHSPGLTCWIA